MGVQIGQMELASKLDIFGVELGCPWNLNIGAHVLSVSNLMETHCPYSLYLSLSMYTIFLSLGTLKSLSDISIVETSIYEMLQIFKLLKAKHNLR